MLCGEGLSTVLSSENESGNKSNLNSTGMASCDNGRGHPEPRGHWPSHIHGSGTQNGAGTQHLWPSWSANFISTCSAFLKRPTKKQITEQESDPLDWLHSWMIWEYDPCLWKKQYLLQFHMRVRKCIIIVEDLENHLRRGSRNFEVKKDDWGFVGQFLWRTWAFSKEIPQEGKQWRLCDLRQESLSAMVSTPF